MSGKKSNTSRDSSIYKVLEDISSVFTKLLDKIDGMLDDKSIDMTLLIYMAIISFILLTLTIGYSISSFDIHLPNPYKDYSKWISFIVVSFTFIFSLITMRYFSKLGGENDTNSIQIKLTYGKIFKNFVSNGISMGIPYIITSFILSFSNIIYCSNNTSTSSSCGELNNSSTSSSCGELNNIMTYLTYPFIISIGYLIVSILIYLLFNPQIRAKNVPLNSKKNDGQPTKTEKGGITQFLYGGLFNIHKILEYIIITGLNIYILLNLTNGFVDSFNNICSKTISDTGWNKFIGVLFSIIFFIVTLGFIFLISYYFEEGQEFMKNLFKIAFDIGNYTNDSISKLTEQGEQGEQDKPKPRRRFQLNPKS